MINFIITFHTMSGVLLGLFALVHLLVEDSKILDIVDKQAVKRFLKYVVLWSLAWELIFIQWIYKWWKNLPESIDDQQNKG